MRYLIFLVLFIASCSSQQERLISLNERLQTPLIPYKAKLPETKIEYQQKINPKIYHPKKSDELIHQIFIRYFQKEPRPFFQKYP